MGATVMAYWPGITAEQREAQPGFYNDDKAWGDFMAEREDEPEALDAIRQLSAGALLTYTTDGVDDEDVEWVTPAELRDAARKLREAIESKSTKTNIILKVYQRNANGIDPVADELIQDLKDIEALAGWAEAEGAKRMTLDVNW
jgi:hypothetical protein